MVLGIFFVELIIAFSLANSPFEMSTSSFLGACVEYVPQVYSLSYVEKNPAKREKGRREQKRIWRIYLFNIINLLKNYQKYGIVIKILILEII